MPRSNRLSYIAIGPGNIARGAHSSRGRRSGQIVRPSAGLEPAAWRLRAGLRQGQSGGSEAFLGPIVADPDGYRPNMGIVLKCEGVPTRFCGQLG